MSRPACTFCHNVAFVRERDGLLQADTYARQALVAYRRAVLARHGLISRRSMIEAYLCAKRLLGASNAL
jgi:hypothetical protein